MGKPTGFLEVSRRDRKYAPVDERVTHWGEFTEEPGAEFVARQASRSPEGRRVVRDSVAKPRKLCEDLGLMTRTSWLLWRALGVGEAA